MENEKNSAKVFLQLEEENRIIKEDERGSSFYECISKAISHVSSADSIIEGTQSFLKDHKKLILDLRGLLDESASKKYYTCYCEKNDKYADEKLDRYFNKVIERCGKTSRKHQLHIKIYIYAVATYLSTPIYILCKNDVNKLWWEYFPPLFENGKNPRLEGVDYITILMTQQRRLQTTLFFLISSDDPTVGRPNARGLIGMFKDIISGTPPDDVVVPKILCYECRGRNLSDIPLTDTFIKYCSKKFSEWGIWSDSQEEIFKPHSTNTASDFLKIICGSNELFHYFCKVLIIRGEREILNKIHKDTWDQLVRETNIQKQHQALIELNDAIVSRNLLASDIAIFSKCTIAEFQNMRKTEGKSIFSLYVISFVIQIIGITLGQWSQASFVLIFSGIVIGFCARHVSTENKKHEVFLQTEKIHEFKRKIANIQTTEEKVLAAVYKVNYYFDKKYTGLESVLGSFSLTLDDIFLSETANNINGTNTNIEIILEDVASTIATRNTIFNHLFGKNQ